MTEQKQPTVEPVYVTYRGREFMLWLSQGDDGFYERNYYEKDVPENQRSDDIQYVSVFGHGLHTHSNHVDALSAAFDDLIVWVDHEATMEDQS